MDNYKLQHMDVDLDKPISEKNVGLVMGSGDELANTFTVSIKRGGETVDLTGCSVTGYLIMPNDETLRINGNVTDNKAYVVIPKSGYVYDGAFQLAVKIVVGGKENTVAIFVGKNARTTTENLVDGEKVVYGVKDILNMIDSMDQAEKDAKAAATSANNAAASANSAAQSASTIARTVENKLDAGDFKGEKGDTGATPNITFHVATGEPGTQVQVAQSGTAENPVVNLTIPRGDTGAVDGIDYFEGNPSALGEASPGAANGVARGDHAHPMPTAAQVGALASDGTAVDADKLGGKAPEYYIQPRNLLDNSDFRNPVNQRGKTIIETAGLYWLDRWRTTANGYYEIKDASIGINSNQNAVSGIEQKLANPTHLTGKTLTIAVFARAVSSNAEMRLCFPYVGEVTNIPLSPEFRIYTYTAIFQANDAGNSVAIFAETGSAIEVAWAALYEGSYTAETLPLYIPKGYAVELVECMRYFQKSDEILLSAVSDAAGYYDAVYPFMIPMRTKPTITAYDAEGNAGKTKICVAGSQWTQVDYIQRLTSNTKVSARGNGVAASSPLSIAFAYEASADL